jgi:hypothetical protein
VTLAPLMLRSAPAMEAEPILVMPHGGVVTLTREGAENGYVTVDYGGVRGWAYADLLGETVGTVQTGTPRAAAPADGSVAPVAVELEPVSAELVYEDPVTVEPVSAEPVPLAADCDPSYPDLCIPPGSADLNCDYVYGLGLSSITVYPPDPHGFDGNGDGIGCEG